MFRRPFLSLPAILFGLVVANSHSNLTSPPVIEGDIVITPSLANLILESNGERATGKRYVIRDEIRHWKNGVVPYKFAPSIGPIALYYAKKAIEEIHNKTCVRMKPQSNEKDYVEFTAGEGCFSSIGRQGGRQLVSIGDGCHSKALVLHEIMHSLGFFHEQSRIDRDFYVRVLWWNIIPGSEKNFATYSHGKVDTLGEPYDIHSIMHYENTAYTKNGQNTIEAINSPEARLGRDDLSEHDVKQIRHLYKCRSFAEAGGKCVDMSKDCKVVKHKKKYCVIYKATVGKLCPKTCGTC